MQTDPAKYPTIPKVLLLGPLDPCLLVPYCAYVMPWTHLKNLLACKPDTAPAALQGFAVTVREQGVRGLVRGWVPTLLGYSVQGAGKFGACLNPQPAAL